jgi:hypothetical protein
MNTRELGDFLRALEFFLSNIPPFGTEGCMSILQDYNKAPYAYLNFYDRDKFVVAVKAIGNCKKTYTDGDYPKLNVTAKAFPIQLSISRDKVCKKTVVYDCEPLFSPEEVEAL